MTYSESMKLFLPDWWYDLPPEAKMAVYNGAGPDYFPVWLRDLLDKVFWWASDAVMVHDVEYTHGTGKIMADWRLFANCILCSSLTLRRVALSAVVYASVALFGRKAWKEGHNHAD